MKEVSKETREPALALNRRTKKAVENDLPDWLDLHLELLAELLKL